jgi:hypothetical protein
LKLARPALCLALVASVSAAGAAGAVTKPKPKPVCNLITDPKGDSSLTTAQQLPPAEDGLDVVGGDIAGNAKQLTAVIRLASVAVPQSAPLGYGTVYTFRAPDSTTDLYFRYASSPAFGNTAEFGYDDDTNGLTSLGTADVKVDTAKNEIHLTAPTSGFDGHGTIKPGTKLGEMTIKTSRDGVVFLLYADEAAASKSYTVGTLSCVTPGK